MIVDLTLDGLRLPALENFTPSFGTKEASGGVSTEHVCYDVMMPFAKQRPIAIFENATTKVDLTKGDVQADCRLSFTAASLTFALGAPSAAGIKVEIMAGFSGAGASIVSFTGPSGATTISLTENKVVSLIANSSLEWEYAGKFCGATLITASATIEGPSLAVGDVAKVMFSQSLAGPDGVTGLELEYNGVDYPVKAAKGGALTSIFAHEISSGTFRYVDAYTSLDLIFDGTEFIVKGNPVVLSSNDYTIYADGKKSYPYNDTKPVAQLFYENYSIAANGIADVLFDITKPGYTPIMIAAYGSGGNDVTFSSVAIYSSTSAGARLRNFSSGSQTLVVYVTVLYTRNLS